MKYFITYLSLVLIATNCYAQDSKSKDFVCSLIGESTKFTYKASISAYEIENIKEAIQQDTIYSIGEHSYNPDKILVLTKAEKLYINQELKKASLLKWSNNLCSNGNVIDNDTLDNIFTDNKRGWSYFKRNFTLKLYSFSQPIFIRNQMLCLFSLGYSCGHLCGEGNLTVFRKEGNVWVAWIKVYKWVS